MSYILEALRQADQRRQREATPITLAAAPAQPTPLRRSLNLAWLLVSLLLLLLGIGIGWWKPWASPPDAAPAAPVQVMPPAPAGPVSAPAKSAPLAKPAPVTVVKPEPEVRTPEPPPAPTSLGALPADLERELPGIRIALHGYSPQPKDRLVMINDRMLHQGDALTPELRLEEITPEGVVLTYKGYRFSRSVR